MSVVRHDIAVADGAVTVLDEAKNMRQIPNPPRAAVCVIRAERQGAGLLITLVITEDIEDSSGQRSLHVTDIGNAVRTVRHFLTRFADSSQ
jgi:hypothetical protein